MSSIDKKKFHPKKTKKSSHLRQILSDLIKSKTTIEKQKCEDELKKYIEVSKSDHSRGVRVTNVINSNSSGGSLTGSVGIGGSSNIITGGSFLDDLHIQLQSLNDEFGIPSDKLASIINFFIDFTENEPRKISIFSNYLRNALSNYKPSDFTTLKKITKALGRLAKESTLLKTLTAEWVHFECKRALEWLEGRDKRMYASILVLKELSHNSPTFFFSHVGEFLKFIWIGLRDANEIIRQGSVQALKPVLILVSERHCPDRICWYHDLIKEVEIGFSKKSPEWVHASLLVTGELLLYTGENLMKGYFDKICSSVIKFGNSKDKLVKRNVIKLIPVLAQFYGVRFCKKYLQKSVQIIFKVFTSNSNRETAYIALGKLCIETKDHIKTYHKKIIEVIKDGLTKKRGRPFIEEALLCLGLYGQAVGEIMKNDVFRFLRKDYMFSNGLSKNLIKALDSISKTIPTLLKVIQIKLLDAISIILSKTPYSPINVLERYTVNPELDNSDVGTITLALSTLGSFDMTGHNLTDFCAECIVKYLNHDNPQIRREAAKTCCTLLVGKNKNLAKNLYEDDEDEMNYQGYVFGEVLQKLLTVAISDANPTIRLAVLENLDERFNRYLALSDNLSLLFISLHDENFKIREVSMKIIGRVSNLNPAYVFSSLRRILLQLLTKLEYSEDSRGKEESAQMLGHLILASPKLIHPYVYNIYEVLKKNILHTNPNVSSQVLDSIGKLSIVGGKDMLKFFDELLPLIIITLQDQSSSLKREIAVRTLGYLVKSTGCVIIPYQKHPKLLNILLSILKSDENWTARKEVIKVLGIIGAFDPYAHKLLGKGSAYDEIETGRETKKSEDDILSDISPSSEEYCPTVAFIELMKILKDSTLQLYHGDVIQCVMYIFRSLGMRCVPYLEQVMGPFFTLIRTSKSVTIKVTLFQQLCVLVKIVKHHIRNYLPEIFELIKDNWANTVSDIHVKIQIISLEEQLCLSLHEEFSKYLPEVVPSIVLIIKTEKSKEILIKCLQSLSTFSKYLSNYLYLVIPCIVGCFEHNDVDIVMAAIQSVNTLCIFLDVFEYSSRIIHPMIRLVEKHQNDDVTVLIMKTLSTLVCQLKSKYLIFVPLVNQYLNSDLKQIKCVKEYESLVTKLSKSKNYYYFELKNSGMLRNETEISQSNNEVTKIQVNISNLKSKWEATHRSAKADWVEWCRGLSVELLKESPSPALRSCSTLAQFYHKLSKDLFNAGFISCWCELDEKSRSEIVRAIELAFSSPELPSEVLQMLLNVAEFMEHDEKALPIAISSLGYFAEKCQCYAKALHYKEIEFKQNPASHIDDLISINNKLHQHEAAFGILIFAQKHPEIEFKDFWFEELRRWKDALKCYEKQSKSTLDSQLGIMRCLRSLGEWEKLGEFSEGIWKTSDEKDKQKLAVICSHSSWILSNWNFMEESNQLLENDAQGNFFRAVLSVHKKEFDLAKTLIDRSRQLLDRDIAALVGESYARAYNMIVVLQQLVELEEVIEFQLNPDKRKHIKKIWKDRLNGISRSVKQWDKILSIRQLVLPPEELTDDYIQLAFLAREDKLMSVSYRVFSRLLIKDFNPQKNPELLLSNKTKPDIAFNYFIHMWDSGEKKESINLLTKFVETYKNSVGNNNDVISSELLSKAYRLLGNWNKELFFENDKSKIKLIKAQFEKAKEYDSESFLSWHYMAVFNSQVAAYLEEKSGGEKGTDLKQLGKYIGDAINGFFKSINLSCKSERSALQDLLRLLTLWFTHGTLEEANIELERGFKQVNVDTWLNVIPQVIARINSSIPQVKRLVSKLLVKIGYKHPQSLVYPLTVCSKSENVSRKEESVKHLGILRKHHPLLIDQALMVSNELIRIAILWSEEWHVGLEEASRLYFGHHNVDEMFRVLLPLHSKIDHPETLSEEAFTQTYGRDLKEAYKWCKRYQNGGRESDLSQAWDLYYSVFRRITKQLQHMLKLELRYISPNLRKAKNMELAVPGTYKLPLVEEINRIGSFVQKLELISSKQRPRKLRINNVHGQLYLFLLKGHEDLRQDERVMQLFGLVNTLLISNPRTRNKYLNIKRFSVIPLSSNAGLGGWVPNCDTLHSLIKEYRESRGVLLNIEHRFMIQMAPFYDHLSLQQKIEVFEYALNNTTGQDLYKILWLKSKSSEVWLDKRTNYTRSLAVMSMVGYILGLGDRHPSNLMLEKHTGKIVHIDFGDCFEVAVNRDKFPEKIPFRLTRMLVNAMEICGIEGTFRSTCENVMKVLRSNKYSVMAMLEAFVHDPLINWRLIETKFQKKQIEKKEEQISLSNLMGKFKPKSYRDMVERRSLRETIALSTTVNKKALSVIKRIETKLDGKDFSHNNTLEVEEQVQLLIEQATSHANLCQCYIGWCAFW